VDKLGAMALLCSCRWTRHHSKLSPGKRGTRAAARRLALAGASVAAAGSGLVLRRRVSV
jgi:hypothetical protein